MRRYKVIGYLLFPLIWFNLVFSYSIRDSARRIRDLQVPEVREVAKLGIGILKEIGNLPPEYQARPLTYLLIAIGKLKEAVKAAQDIGEDYDRSEALQSISEACVKIGPKSLPILEEALKVAQGIRKRNWRRYALRSISEAYYKIGKEEKAIEILEEALEVVQGIEDEEDRSKALQSISEACGKIGLKSLPVLGEILKVAQGIGKESWRRYALRSISEAYYKIGEEEKALKILEEALKVAQGIRDEYRRSSIALRSISEAYYKIGKEEKAIEILEEALKVAQGIRKRNWRSEALRSISEACGKIGLKSLPILEEALKVAQGIGDEYWRSIALQSISETYYKIGKKEKALKILEEALNVAQSIENEYLRSKVLQSISEAYYEIGEEKKALEILGESIKLAHGIEGDFRGFALQSISEVCSKIGPKSLPILEEALQVAQGIEYKNDRELYVNTYIIALRSISEACVKIGSKSLPILEEALKEVQGIHAEPCCSKALQSISEALGEIGKEEKAIEILEEALKVAQGIWREDWRSKALRSISEAYYEIGEEEKALKILEEALKVAQGSIALQSISEAWGKIAGKFNLTPYLINLYQEDTLSPEEKILLGVILDKGEIDSIAKNNYDKALLYYGYCLPNSDPEILNWAKEAFKKGKDTDIKKAIVDLIGLIASKKDFKALGFLEGQVKNKILARDLKDKPITEVELHLLRVLSEIEPRSLVPLIVREDVPLEIREEFLNRLADKGKIDEGLKEILKKAKEEAQTEEFFNYLTQVYKEFNIIAPPLLMDNLLKGNISIEELREYIQEFEGKGFEELIKLLKEDKKARFAYYCLKQPEFRYSAGNYSYTTFSKAIDEIAYPIEGANDEKVLEEFRQALERKVGKDEAEFIISQIKQGKAPLRKGSEFLDEEGKFIPQEISLEYSNQVRQNMEEILKDTYKGLIALLKLNYVVKKLKIKVEEMTTPDAMEKKLNELLKEHPESKEEAGGDLANLTKKMKSNPLLGALLQVTDPAKIRSLAEITEPDLDRFLGYLKKKGINLEEVLDELEKEIIDTLRPTYFHLREGFKNLIRLSEERKEVGGRIGSRKVSLIYAGKYDLINFLRFADGAQCCITSTSGGHFRYVPYALADYMSHVFILVDEKKNQIGYILTHYGIEGDDLVLLSLQAYIKEGYYTEEGLRNIWEVMSRVARDMGVRKIIIAGKSYGLGREPSWLPKQEIKVKKLQSLRSYNLVDDLGLPKNEYKKGEFYVIDITP